MKTTSIKTELTVIISILDGDPKARAKWLTRIRREHFGFPAHQEIFERILHLSKNDKSIPPTKYFAEDISLSDEAKEVLKTKIKPVPVNNLRAIVHILNDTMKARLLSETLKQVSVQLQGKGPKDILSIAANTITELSKINSSSRVKSSSNKNCLSVVEEILNGDKSFVETGIKKFDSENGGFPNGQVIVLAANPGGGKSAFAIQLAINQFTLGYSPLIFSMEMDSTEIWRRITSNISGVAHDHLVLGKMNSEKKESVRIVMRQFKGLKTDKNNIFSVVCPQEDLKFSEALPILQSKNPDIIYIDYISLLKPEDFRVPKHEQLGEITRLAKKAATRLNIPIVLLAQINKEDEIKYSGAIQENSGLTIQWSHQSNAIDENGCAKIEMNISKARNQKRFLFSMDVDFRTMRFKDSNRTGWQ